MRPVASPLFQGLSAEEWAALEQSGCLRTKSYPRHAVIFHAGEQVHALGVVLRGTVHIENLDLWGSKSILSSISAGQAFAETYATAKNASYNAAADQVEEGTVQVTFDAAAAQKLVAQAQPGQEITVPAQIQQPKVSKEALEKAAEMLALVGISDPEAALRRYPHEFSGGQRQRVALGRAIVKNQKLFLMDEPLSNLDAKLRVSMRSEISKLHRQLGSTTIYVTHDQVEAMTMADRIVIMKDGVIQQVGKPMDLYEHPANKFVAGFIGSPQMNFYAVKVTGTTMTFSDGNKMHLPESVVSKLNGRQGAFILGIRGEDIKLDPQNLDLYKNNIMSATVDSVEVMGNENNLYFNFGGTGSVARVSKYEISKPGDTIDFTFVPSRMHFFDTQTEESLF